MSVSQLDSPCLQSCIVCPSIFLKTIIGLPPSLCRTMHFPLHQQEGAILRQVQPRRGQAEPLCGRNVR